mmetsp:Transcript_44602/g.105756  ORF Transcript_44602/g.105756 Transcript_44602/m.105756 type:complete len:282 (-) Transcript_44602:35-880(-)
MAVEEVSQRVLKCKSTLEKQPRAEHAHLVKALEELASLGELPAKVLADTKIGVVVNHLVKDSTISEDMRNRAKTLVDDWKQQHRKRKSCTQDEKSVPDAVSTPAKVPKAAMSSQRQTVQSKLEAALLAKSNPSTAVSTQRAAELAAEIEAELHQQLNTDQNDKAYTSQTRSILYNLKDSSNSAFGAKLLSGELLPSTLPTMTSEDMASEHKSAERAKARLESLQESAVKADDNAQVTDAYTCERCKGKRCTYTVVTPPSCVNGEHSWTSVTCLGCGHKWKA